MREVGGPDAERAEARRGRLRRLAWLLDSSLRIPIVGWRIGVEALLGLVPGVGDAVGTLLSGYILAEAWRLGAPRAVLLRMAANVALEAVVGLLPVAGDLFDMAWKANQRNVRLLDEALARPQRTAVASRLLLGSVAAALGALVLGALAVGVWIGWALLGPTGPGAGLE